MGHAYFLEDGDEEGSVLKNNLVAGLRKADTDIFIPSDGYVYR